MNLRNFCIFPDGNSYWPDKAHPKRKPKHLRGTSWTLTKELASGRFLWLPLELNGQPQIEMPSPVIVFNITQDDVDNISARFGLQPYYYSLADDAWKNPSLHLPVEAIARVYTLCDKAIEWAKEHDECYNQRYDENLEELLEPGRTGYSRWLHRCRLYGGLLNAYNYH